jgi:hypothetical protein
MAQRTLASPCRELSAIVLVAAAIAGCQSPPFLLKASSTNTAILDGQFVQSPVKVRLPVTEAVRLDVTEFVRDFEKHYNVYEGAQPNAIQVVTAEGKFHLDWRPNTNEYMLGPKALKPLPLLGDRPFAGFSKGADGMIIIGRERIEGTDTVMNPMWIAMFKVE